LKLEQFNKELKQSFNKKLNQDDHEIWNSNSIWELKQQFNKKLKHEFTMIMRN
jgi:hypothetical protein